MEIVCNKFIPFKGWFAMNVFGKMYIREENCGREIPDSTYNHESIHTAQSEDFIPNKDNKNWKRILGYLIFYILYGLEWLVKGICFLFYWKIKVYMSLSFEQEAYENQYNLNYLEYRSRWAWTKYLFKIVK